MKNPGKLYIWGIVISIFETEQDWNELGPKKQFILWKQFFNNFIMFFRINQFLRCMIKFISNETFSNIFRSIFCWGNKYLKMFYMLFIFYCCQQVLFTGFSFFITITIKWCFCWYCWWWGFYFPLYPEAECTSRIHLHHPYNRHLSRMTVIGITATVLKICWNP